MSSNNPARTGQNAISSSSSSSAGTAPYPPARPRKSKWNQGDGPVLGLVRRKGERDPRKWNVLIDPQYARFAPKGWSPALPPLSEKKKKKKKNKPPSTSSSSSSSSGSGSEKKRGFLEKFKFWKKNGKKGKEQANNSRGRSTAQGASGSGRRSRSSS